MEYRPAGCLPVFLRHAPHRSCGNAVQLIGNHDNSPGFGREALYVEALILEPGIVLDLAGRRLYYSTIIPVRPYASDSGVKIVDSLGGGKLVRLDDPGLQRRPTLQRRSKR